VCGWYLSQVAVVIQESCQWRYFALQGMLQSSQVAQLVPFNAHSISEGASECKGTFIVIVILGARIQRRSA